MNTILNTNNREGKGLNRFTINARKMISEGYAIASEYGYKEYKPIHLLYVLLKERSGLVHEIFNKIGVDIDKSIATILAKLDSEKKSKKHTEPIFSSELKDLINESFVVAQGMGNVYVGTEHLLLALFKLRSLDFVQELANLGVDYEGIKRILMSIGNYSIVSSAFASDESEMDEESKSLPFFCRDMNELSIEGKFFEITGRDKEIKRLVHILSRKTKNNPILVGEAGVGKTAIIEGFVNNIIAKKVPASFLGKKVLSLDIAAIIAGARLRGDIEERITAVINEALADGNTILFIDEIHMIVGAGSAGGRDSMDIANILKPYLTNSNLSVIGATTYDEYSKYFESDSALARRFQPIFVEELSQDAAKEVMYKLSKSFAEYHGVKIPKDSVDVVVDLSAKFIKDRYLPDKAIDVLDEAAASLKVGREIAMEPELSSLGKKLLEAQKLKNQALSNREFKEASRFKKKEESIISQIESVVEGKGVKKGKYTSVVTPELVREIIVDWTKIPIAASDISDKTLQTLGQRISERIVGQDRVVENVVTTIQKSHLGLSGENRPLASFMFLGPTGVGKTELAKGIANELFGSQKLMFQVNMSEYMEMHSVSKLIGSPPGYVGYQEGGQLTTFVKRKPYSVVLFDEIEKAHPDVLNLLLQILDEGELTDGKGARISFKNTIIVITSNIGAETIGKDSRIGFNVSAPESRMDEAYEEMKERVLEQLKDTVRPELLNRIDLIDVFRGLNKEDCRKIVGLQMNELVIRLLGRGIMLEFGEDVVDSVNEKGYSTEYGGRNIRRKIQEFIENGLTKFVLASNIKPKRSGLIKIKVKVDENGLPVFNFIK